MSDKNDMVILQLGGVPYELRMTHRVIKRFSATTGASMTELEDTINHYDKLSLLLWIMITEDQRRTGKEWMGAEALDDLLDDVPLGDIQMAIGKAISAAFPAPAEAPADPQTAAGASTGA